MIGTVLTQNFDAPQICREEIFRYIRAGKAEKETSALVESCLKEAIPRLHFQVCYREFPIALCGEVLDLGFTMTSSDSLKKALFGCDSLVLFAATIGVEIDRLILKYSSTSPAKALIFQGIGAERVESLCDRFVEEMKKIKHGEGKSLCPRFSPGFGDVSLEMQKDIFRVLDCSRKIGLTLNESLLMSPSKSVTALIGVKNRR